MSKKKQPEMEIATPMYKCTYCGSSYNSALQLFPFEKKNVNICANCLIKVFDKILK